MGELMSDVITITESIEDKIRKLEIGRNQLAKRAIIKAETRGHYEKQLAITMLKLRNGGINEWEDLDCENLPNTLIEKVARGIVFQEKIDAERAEAEYKNAIVGMDSIKSELNGYQTISRNISESINIKMGE